VAGTAASEIMAELAETTPADRDWNSAPLAEVVREIVDRHHAWLHAELSLLDHLFALVAHSQEGIRPLERVFSQLKAELESHLGKEERVLFPAILRMETLRNAGKPVPRPPFGTVRNPISMMEHDHEQAMLHLDEMRDLTYGYDLPEDACHGLRMLYRELQALEADLHTHLHLENNILFPRAANLEQA
jgi:regulator of cell morphogenesis and NO signaling